MKTLKNLTLIALVTILLFACEDPFREGLNSVGSLETEQQDENKGGKNN